MRGTHLPKRRPAAAAVKAICVALALGALAAPATAQTAEDDFADFRIPDHSWRSANLSLGGSYFDFRDAAGIFSRRGESWTARANSRVSRVRDSETLAHSIEINLATATARQWQRLANDYGGSRSERQLDVRPTFESWLIAGGWRRYWGSQPIAVELAGTIQGAYGQEESEEHLANLVPPPDESVIEQIERTDRRYRYAGSLTAMLGVGRVRDATGIYDTYILEERLRASGALTRPLSREGRQRLAALFYVSPRYGAAHDRPERFFWRDLERLLREDGALAGEHLDAYSVLKALETAFPVVNRVRQRGHFVGPVVTARFDQIVDHFDSRFRTERRVGDVPVADDRFHSVGRIEFNREEVLTGAQGEFHRPFGPRWQLDARARVQVPVLHVKKGFDSITDARVAYLVADRWLVAGAASHARSYVIPDPGYGASRDLWDVAFGAELAWYLEDHVVMRLTADSRQAEDGDDNHRTTGVRLDLTYSFWRGLDAPGLIDPVRPVP